MNLHASQVLILCVCLGQICLGSKDFIEKNLTKERIRDEVYGASKQFIDDFMVTFETYRNDSELHTRFLMRLLNFLKKIPIEKNSKIDVNQVRNINYTSLLNKDFESQSAKFRYSILKMYQSIFSKKLPSERYNGIMNLYYIIYNRNATSEEIESALNYLYGIDTAATKTSFSDHLPDLVEGDCPFDTEAFSELIARLKTMIDIKSKVVQDFTIIHEKFPCNLEIRLQLLDFVQLLTRLRGDKSKINACKFKEYLESDRAFYVFYERILKWLEIILPTRLPDETFRGILSFAKATRPNTPIDEIEKALEYLYDDVPKTECTKTATATSTATESSTQRTE